MRAMYPSLHHNKGTAIMVTIPRIARWVGGLWLAVAANAWAALPYGVSCQFANYGGTGSCEMNDIEDDNATFQGSVAFDFNGLPASETGAHGMVRSRIGDSGIEIVAGGFAHDQFWVSGSVSAVALWSDSMVVTSPTLALGTPVRMRFTHELEMAMSASPDLHGPYSSLAFSSSLVSSAVLAWSSASNPSVGLHDQFSYQDATLQNTFQNQYVIDTIVGGIISVSYTMSASMHWMLEQPTANIPDASRFTANIDAGNSGHIYFEALDPGVVLVADSGHDFTPPSPVPEPSAWALMLLGLGALAGRRHLAVSKRGASFS
jgi:hypothetical protein